MSDRKEDIIQNSGRIIFMVLFFLLAISFSGRSEKPTYDDSQYELTTRLHSTSVKAILVDFVHVPFFQKSLLTTVDKSGFQFCNYKFKLSTDNLNSIRQILFTENASLSLKPLSFCRFYYHLFSAATKEVPLLS
jgi:hypothetical protein